MLSSAQKIGGRGFAVVVWSIGLATLIMATILLLFSWEPPGSRSWLALAEMTGSYFVMVGIIGAAAQAGNAAERLPGIREFKNQHRGHGQDRRLSDTEREEK